MFPTVQFLNVQIPTFFLTLSVVSVLVLFLIQNRARHWYRNFFWLPDDFVKTVWSLTLWILIGSFIGGRLGHVLIEEPRYYLAMPERVFAFWMGGFVFFGGFFLAVAFSTGFLLWKKTPQPLIYFDFFAPVVSLSYVLGRIGCFLNGCCYGKVCDLPWDISMADAQGLVYSRHPTQLYSAAWELGLFLFLYFWQKPKFFYLFRAESLRAREIGSLFVVWLFFHSLGRFILEFWRDDFRGPEFLLTPSGWISLCLMVICLFVHPQAPARIGRRRNTSM
jgi:phosphatidylglycerol:prolipoprotein diacylglycerol transferase